MEKQMTKNQEEMLNFLRHTSIEHPLDLDTGFALGDEKHRTTLYRECIELVHSGYIKEKYLKGTQSKYWITEQGLEALKNLRSKPK